MQKGNPKTLTQAHPPHGCDLGTSTTGFTPIKASGLPAIHIQEETPPPTGLLSKGRRRTRQRTISTRPVHPGGGGDSEPGPSTHAYSASMSLGGSPPFKLPTLSAAPQDRRVRPHLLPPTRHPVVVRLVALGGELVLLHDLECPQQGERVTSQPLTPTRAGVHQSLPHPRIPLIYRTPRGHQIAAALRRKAGTPLSTRFPPRGPGVVVPRGFREQHRGAGALLLR